MNWTEKSQTERLPPSLSYTQTPSCVTLSSSLPAPSLPLFTSLPLPFFFPILYSPPEAVNGRQLIVFRSTGEYHTS